MTNLPQNLREFDDTDKARELIYKGALDAVSKRFPVEDDEYRIELMNPRYTGPQDFSLEQQKQALMKERRLTTPITGTWRLIHKPTNSVLDQRDDVVMQIPYYTQRGTFINGGNEYSVVSQSRLRPGVYVRRQRTGDVEAHFNVRPGKGKPFRIQLEPETGVFKLVIGQSANPLYPMLRAMGITDQQLIKSWGPDLLSANVKKQDARALSKIYQRMAGYKADPAADASAQERYLRDSLPLFELDADVNARTLGLQNAAGITPEVLLRTTGKMLGVSRGEEDADDRDSPQFSHVFSIEDMIRERIDKDAGRLTQQLLRKVRRTRNLQPVRRGALNSYFDSLLLGSGLAMPLEETNPLHTLEQLHRVTKLGEGGIGSAEAITDEARDVNPGQFCYDDETMVLTSDGFKYWRDVTEDTLLACDCGDAVGFYKPVAVTHEHYSGPMVGIANKYLDYLVTPNHRVYCSTHKKPTAFRCEEAVAVYKAQRNYRVGGTPYIDKNDCPTHFTVPLAEIVPGHPGRSLTAHTFAAEDWATFMGWFLAEGSTVVDDKRHSYKVQIAQSATANPAKCAAIAALLERMGLASCYTGAAFTVASKDIVAYLRPLGYAHEKRIPRYFFNYSYACRLALFDAMAAGDGSTADNGSVRYVTTSYGLALDYAELALSLGYSATICEVTSKPLNDRCRKRWRVGVSRTRAVIHTGYSSKARLADAVELDYDGMVHCARVPGGLLLVMRNGKSVWSGNSFIDPITGPEGLSIGIDVRTAYRTFKGDDNNIYGEFRNPHTGKLEYLRPDQAADKIIAFPGQNIAEAKTVYAMKRGRVERVPRDEVDYQVPSFGHMMSPNTNLNPMPTSVQPGRQFYGSKFWSQYMPQVKGEVPLVDSLMPDGKSTFTEHYGRKVGTIQSKVGGTVTKVTDDTITVTDADGKKHVTQLVKNFPFNRLTGLSYFPAVKVGDPVAPGDMVAHSNFTDAKTGALNMGHNLKTAIIPYKGRSYEDAYVISESAAQKMATERLYGFDLGAKHGVELGRSKYMSAFPRNFTQDQIDTLDGDGVVKPGTVLHKGDPIIVAVGPRLLTSADSQLGKLHKVLRNAFTDKSQVWEYAWPGTVTDVAMTHNGARVNVKSTPPVSVGDKLSTRFGLKGVVGHIVPDDKMPRDVATNEPYELLLNPMAVLSRVAPNQIMEMALGKLAKIKGEQLRIPQEPPPEGWANWVEQQLREHGVDEATDLFDPDTGRTVKRIGDGYVYVSAFHHLAEKKLSSRGETGGYTCHDADTDVLTSSGWVNWASVSDDADFAVMDDAGRLSFQRASAVIRAAYSGPMYGFSGLFVDYLVTPNHRMWVRPSAAKACAYAFMPADRIDGKRVAVRTGGLLVDERATAAVTVSNAHGTLTFDAGDFSEFIGWYVSEGSVRRCTAVNKTEHKVYIWQRRSVNRAKFDRIFLLMTRMGLAPYAHRAAGAEVGIACSNKILAEYVSACGCRSQDKRLPREIFGLGAPNLRRTLEAMLLGDGSTATENGKPVSRYTTSSAGLAGDFQELTLRLGLGSNIRPYDRITRFGPTAGFTCSVCYSQHERTLRRGGGRYVGDYYVKEYTGTVYCATVPAGRLITRRNGLVLISGNSDDQPARGGYSGAKKFSQMDVNAALAHGATDVIKDVVTIRGTKNEDFWKALKLGRPLPEPRTPFIYDKFLNTLRAGGINVTEKGDTTSLLPMTDDDVDKLSKGRIDNSDMVDSDFEPMRGGLFDPGRTGGAAGNRWTHIELPEPVPNPVMEEPVRRLLGLKIQDMEDILAGRKDLDGKTGGGALKAALDRIDIDRMLDEHKQKIRTLRGANRDNSMKILGYLASAKEQGIHPSKWMISKVPVLPPVFRPVSRMGDVALMADLNELYRDVIENAKSFQELRKDLPESELAEERLNLYKSVQAAYGLGESITPEGQSKRLKGAIRQVIGTSPKYGLFQSKVISKPVDVVGRGVVTPDPNLDMDQVGIPEDSAWALYKDFVMRGLVRHGYPALRASEMIEQRTPEAKDALEKEMQTRPVLLDRAPTWHKFNLLAFYPHITEGHTIRVSPLVTKGFNMDFDGDQANFHVPVSDKAVDQAKRKMLPSANLFSLTDLKSIRHSPSMEMTMGLYWLTRPAAGKPVRVFASTKAAKDAYRNGEIAANDPIEIRG